MFFFVVVVIIQRFTFTTAVLHNKWIWSNQNVSSGEMYTSWKESSSFGKILQVETNAWVCQKKKKEAKTSNQPSLLTLSKDIKQVKINKNQKKCHSCYWSSYQHATIVPVTILTCFSFTIDFITPVDPCSIWIFYCLTFCFPVKQTFAACWAQQLDKRRGVVSAAGLSGWARPCDWLWKRECETCRRSSLAPFRCGMVWMVHTLLLLFWYPTTTLQTSGQRHSDWRSRLGRSLSAE